MKPFDSFDEFANPIFASKPAEVIEEPVAETKTRGRKKKEVAEPVDIPADVPVVEE